MHRKLGVTLVIRMRTRWLLIRLISWNGWTALNTSAPWQVGCRENSVQQNLTYKAREGSERRHRFSELVLYILSELREDDRLGSTKLNKILHRIDFESFRQLGKPLTGVEYQKNPHGPCAKMFLPIMRELESSGDVRQSRKPVGVLGIWHQTVYQAVRQSTIELSEEEKFLVDQVIEEFRPLTNKQAEDRSHGIAWRIYDQGEAIPYEASLISDKPITDVQRERARRLASRL